MLLSSCLRESYCLARNTSWGYVKAEENSLEKIADMNTKCPESFSLSGSKVRLKYNLDFSYKGKYIKAWLMPRIDAVNPENSALPPSYNNKHLLHPKSLYILSLYLLLKLFDAWTGTSPYRVLCSAPHAQTWISQLACACAPPRKGSWVCCISSHWCQQISSTAWRSSHASHTTAWNSVSSSHTRGSIWCERGGCRTPIWNNLYCLVIFQVKLPL